MWTAFVARHHRAARPGAGVRRGDSRGDRGSPSGPTSAPSGGALPSPPPRSALAVTFLAHQAWLMSDAIGRTLVRLYLTRRPMLEWTTAAQSKSGLSLDITGVYRRMRGALVLAGAAGVAGGPACGPRAGRSPRRSSCSGPVAAGGPMGQPATARRSPTPTPVAAGRPSSSARRRAAPGGSSRPSSGPTTLSCRPTISRRTRSRSSPIARRRPTSGSTCLSTVAARDFGWLGTLETARPARGHPRDDEPPRALPGPLLQLV